MRDEFINVIKKAQKEEFLETEEIKNLLSPIDEEEKNALYSLADDIRKKYAGDGVHLRGIIEISNICRRNCLYCGLRRGNRNLTRYRMSEEEILETASFINYLGIKTIVLQSGEDLYFTKDRVAKIVYEIKEKTGAAITLSLGEREYQEYKLWKDAGADRYLLKHETANKELFNLLKPDSDFDERIKRLYWLKEIGYQVGAGNMVGLPLQRIEDLALDLAFLRDFQADMAGIGPFIPHPDTPLKNHKIENPELSLITLAVGRIVLKDTHLPATTALRSLIKDGLKKALNIGANVVMPNFTPEKFKEKYYLYPNRIKTGIKELIEDIESTGRYVDKGYGHSLKIKGQN